MERQRSSSVTTLTDFWKRKREEMETSIEEALDQSKKTLKSTEGKTFSQEQRKLNKMEESTLQIIKDMFKTEITNLRETIIKENNELKQEIKKTRDEMKIKEETWRKEKERLEMRIENLEERWEKKERREKRNNIVIKGIKFPGKEIVKEVELFIENELKIKKKVNEAYKIKENEDREIIIAKLESWKEKKEIMENKYKLAGKRIFIENDMTYGERIIQKKIQELQQTEREKGRKTKMGYKKITNRW